MLRKRKSIGELDAEIARLEAELEALEGGGSPPPRQAEDAKEEAAPEDAGESGGRRLKLPFGRKRKDADAPPEDSPADAPADDDAEDEPTPEEAPKRGFLKKLKQGRGKAAADDTAPPEDAPAAEDAPEPEPPGDPEPVAPTANGGTWRHEDGVWTRVTPDAESPAFRRELDADGNVVQESPATDEDLAVVRAEGGDGAARKVLGFLKRRSG